MSSPCAISEIGWSKTVGVEVGSRKNEGEQRDKGQRVECHKSVMVIGSSSNRGESNHNQSTRILRKRRHNINQKFSTQIKTGF
jgi:hypothetical protein